MASWWRRGRKEVDGVEQLVVDRAREEGGFALKVVAAGLVGFPDRIVVLPGGTPFNRRGKPPRVGFLEAKRRGEEPEEEQMWWLVRLRGLGFVADWASNRVMVEHFFKELLA